MEAEIQAFLSSLESQPNYSENTRLAYRSDLRSFLNMLKETLQRSPTLADFNAPNIISFLEQGRLSGMRPGTLLRRLATLRRFGVFLVHEGYLKAAPVGQDIHSIAQSLASPSHKDPPLCLSEAEVLRLKDYLNKSPRPLARRDHALLAVLLETGLSVSTLVAINLNDLDLRLGSIRLHTPKVQNIRLPLNSAVELIAIYLKEGRPELSRTTNEPALFISQVGTRLSRQSVWQILRHWGEVAQLPYPLTPRLVRHTAALRLAQSGRAVSEIQALLGHSNLLSTQALLHRLKRPVS